MKRDVIVFMKKRISIVVIVVLTICICSCGNNDVNNVENLNRSSIKLAVFAENTTKALEITPTTKQQIILNTMLEAFRNEDYEVAYEQLYVLDQLRTSSDNDVVKIPIGISLSYVNKKLITNYTGITLAMDGDGRFYYGILKNGVPNGNGIRLVLKESYYKSIVYFMIKGYWDDGLLTGEADILIDQFPLREDRAYRNRIKINAEFDSGEIISKGSVKQYIEMNYSRNPNIKNGMKDYVYNFQYNIINGKLDENEWKWNNEYDIWMHKAQNTSHGFISYIGVDQLGKECYQNPYPWAKPYRFGLDEMFYCEPTIRYEHN